MKQFRNRRISPEFKTEAVKLMNEGDVEIWELARYMNISESTMRRWKRKVEEEGNNAFKDKDVPNKVYSFLFGSAEDALFWYKVGQVNLMYYEIMDEVTEALQRASRFRSY